MRSMLLVLAAACADPQVPTPTRPELVQTLRPVLDDLRRAVTWIDEPFLPDGGPAHHTLAGGKVHAILGPDRVTLTDAREASPTWSIGMTLARFGAPDRLERVPAGTTWADGPNFESRRPGILEFTESRAEGLEHGVWIESPPGGDTLVVEFDVFGGRPQRLVDGVRIRGPGGAVDWRGLAAFDDRRQSLRTELAVDERTIRVSVDVRGATWPVLVDPLLTVVEATGTATGLAGQPAPSLLGAALDLDGETLLLGDPGAAGAVAPAGSIAWLAEDPTWAVDASAAPGLVRSGLGVALSELTAVATGAQAKAAVYGFDPVTAAWARETDLTLLATDAAETTVDLSPLVLVVGVPSDGNDVGRVEVFEHTSTNAWTRRDPLGAVGTVAGARLGAAVAVDGVTVVAGAPGDSVVHVWKNDAGATTLAADLAVDVPSFGSAVDVEGDWLAVGAPDVDTVYVYHRGEAAWEAPVAVAAPPVAEAGFGERVAIHGATLVVTDHPVDGDVQVHEFAFDAGAWEWINSYPAGPAGETPASLALTGDLLAVGLPDSAQYVVWSRSADQAVYEQLVVSDANDAGDFGAIALDGDMLAIGDYSGLVGCGGVYVFERDDQGVFRAVDGPLTACTSFFEWPNEATGKTLALVERDVILAGNPDYNSGQGRVVAWNYVGDHFDAAYTQLLPDMPVAPRFGASIATNGNIAAIGAPGQTVTLAGFSGINVGLAYVFSRNRATGAWTKVTTIAPGIAIGDEMGTQVGMFGDVIAVGGPYADAGLSVQSGRVELWSPSALGVWTETDQIGGQFTGEQLGASLALRDGALVVGAPGTLGIGMRVWDLDATGAFPTYSSAIGTKDVAVAVTGDRVLSGTSGATPADWTTHVRERSAGAWTEIATLDGQPKAADGSTVIVNDAGGIQVYTLAAANVPPIAADDAFSTNEDLKLDTVVSVLANDADGDGDTLTAILDAPPPVDLVSSFLLDSDGTFALTPAANQSGDAVFTYWVSDDGGATLSSLATVTVTIAPINDAPLAGADTYDVSLRRNAPNPQVVVAAPGVLGNDFDLEGAHLSATLASSPPRGALDFAADGSFVLSPVLNTDDTYSFTYRAVDAEGASSVPAAVSVKVTFVNNPPEVHRPLIAYSVEEDGAVVSTGLGLLDPEIVSDPDGDPLTAQVLFPPEHGGLVASAGGDWRYTPFANYSGVDTFSYVVSDGELLSPPIVVSLTVNGVNDAPVAQPDGPFTAFEDRSLVLGAYQLLVNDLEIESPLDLLAITAQDQPAHGQTTVVDGDVVFTPDPEYSGPDSFTYVVADPEGAASAPVTVTLVVEPVNDPPLATDDDLGQITTSAARAVSANDRDADGDPLVFELVSPPLGGQATLTADGQLTYTAYASFAGADRLTYVARDPAGVSSNLAEVTVVVLPDDSNPTTSGPTPCTAVDWYLDADGDGQGSPAVKVHACEAPASYVANADDCDDAEGSTYLGAREVPDDGIDQNCDKLDNSAKVAGACSTGGAAPSGWALALGAALILVRRRSRW